MSKGMVVHPILLSRVHRLHESSKRMGQDYIALLAAMGDRTIPLADRYSVMDSDLVADHFKLMELESIFDPDEVAEIESWEGK